MDMSKIHASEFSQDHLTVRKYYFNFSMVPGLSIEHTGKGTVISVTDASEYGDGVDLCTMAEICPTEKPVRFEYSFTGIRFEVGYKVYQTPFVVYGKVNKGSIMQNNGLLITKIGCDEWRVPMENENVCVMCIYIAKCKKQ